ncbi:MAG: GTP-binding protein [Steroidobacteraceae bacterium]
MCQSILHPAIPVNIITGALGAGKTTAIARLLAGKPLDESWLVILNEFTDTGIDTLTLAAAARGAYDVRMIPGGCLCCTGEEDFRRQLSGLLALPVGQWPTRILIEPSGIGHPGAIVEELRTFERSGALRLHSTIALLDAQHNADWSALDAVTRAQVDAADVLLLSKADLADEALQQSFLSWAKRLFPAKRFVASCMQGVIPMAALSPPPAVFEFELPVRPLLHAQAHRTAHDHSPQVVERQLRWSDRIVQARVQRLLGREACGWLMPASLLFKLPSLQALLESDDSCWQGVERFKSVLRTGVDRWHLLQRWGRQHSIAECNWSQDCRIEVQLAEGVQVDWSLWDWRWQSLSEPCPVE